MNEVTRILTAIEQGDVRAGIFSRWLSRFAGLFLIESSASARGALGVVVLILRRVDVVNVANSIG